jgi:hypothetical protein
MFMSANLCKLDEQIPLKTKGRRDDIGRIEERGASFLVLFFV